MLGTLNACLLSLPPQVVPVESGYDKGVRNLALTYQIGEVRDRDERIREREDRIKRLTNELEKLKKIDMERRPSRPPN